MNEHRALPPAPDLPPGVLFAPVPAWLGIAVDSTARLWSCRSRHYHRRGEPQRLDALWRLLEVRPEKTRGAYLAASVGRGKCLKLHHAMLLAFRGPRPAGMECRHLNDLKHDNRLDNLAWGTPAENVADAHRNGRYRRGELAGTAKLTTLEVYLLRAACLFASQREVARVFGVSQSAVWDALHGRRWRHLR